LREVSVHYKTFSNILTIRIITAEYLLAMKLMSGRQYKNDLSDIVGILWEHQKKNNPLSKKSVEGAILSLYGKTASLPEMSAQLLDYLFNLENYEALYLQIRDSEVETRQLLLEFNSKYPDQIKSGNIDDIISSLMHNRHTEQKKSLLDKLEEKKRLADKTQK
jgi:hypothetical protein